MLDLEEDEVRVHAQRRAGSARGGDLAAQRSDHDGLVLRPTRELPRGAHDQAALNRAGQTARQLASRCDVAHQDERRQVRREGVAERSVDLVHAGA